ncbi:alpha-(1-_6)-mannopyranosyltransferase A [Williamsia sp. 1138]|uniref:alpha-(1->6)-mannopyranosyltransferase A n=1 Tax=Williamsia sp. 1138 TaxID=1903117 RepID=UPI001FEE00C5|nr:alpha-(1->6)-mannopyranosyltransferase A [Williamsia sp. 1138]
MSTTTPMATRGVRARLTRARVSVGDFCRTDLGRQLLLGCAGSLLVTAGSFGVGDVPRNETTLQTMHLTWLYFGHGKTLSGLAFWLGVALMVISWVQVGRTLRADPSADRPTRALGWASLAQSAPLMIAVPLYSRDVYAYLAQGALLRDGFNPYSDGPVVRPGPLLDSMAQVWATTTAPYGPAFMSLTRAVTTVTGDQAIVGVLVMRLVLIPGLLLTLWALPRLARHFGTDPAMAIWVVALNPLVLIHLVGGPHVELLMMGVLIAGITLVVQRRHVAGVSVLALAASIKITAGVAIPFVLWIWLAHIREDRRARARSDESATGIRPADVAGVLAWIIGLSGLIFGALTLLVGHGFGWLLGLTWAAKIINWLTIPTAMAHLTTLVSSPFVSLPLLPVLEVARSIGSIVLSLTLIGLWVWFRRTERDAVKGMAWAMLAVLLLEPSTLPWYYTWALVIAAVFTIDRRGLVAIVAFSVFLLQVFGPSDDIFMYEITDVIVAIALSALAGWSLVRRDPLRIRWLTRGRGTDGAGPDS